MTLSSWCLVEISSSKKRGDFNYKFSLAGWAKNYAIWLGNIAHWGTKKRWMMVKSVKGDWSFLILSRVCMASLPWSFFLFPPLIFIWGLLYYRRLYKVNYVSESARIHVRFLSLKDWDDWLRKKRFLESSDLDIHDYPSHDFYFLKW